MKASPTLPCCILPCFGVACLVAVAACADAPVPAAQPPTAGVAAPAAPGPAAPTTPSRPTAGTPLEDQWHCGDELMPPHGFQQDTAFVDGLTNDARERAIENATKKLTARLCGNASAADCKSLEENAKSWRTGSNATGVCAMAVIDDQDLEKWKYADLDQKLGQAAGELLGGLGPDKRVAVDRIRDLGVPGGQRADWLRVHMERFLGDRGALTDIPKGWAGDGQPPGVDVIVRCDLFARVEQGVPTLEADWVATGPGTRRVRSSPVSFREDVAPAGPAHAAEPSLPESAGISVRLDAMRGGSLCAGDRTQIWLKSEENTRVRVFDLYGDAAALTIFPNEDQADSLVAAGQSVALGGPQGFEAVPVPGSDQERFLVLAAPNEAALGRFKSAKGTCRVPPDLARQLHAGKGIPPGVKVASTGYRLESGKACPTPVPRDKRDGVAIAIQSLPVCHF